MDLVFSDIKCSPAPRWKRILAALIDSTIALGLVFIPLVNFALIIGYALSRDSWGPLKGQSIGKKILGIRVMNTFTSLDLRFDYKTDITRNLPLLFLGLDMLMIFFSKTNSRYGDIYAHTVVVQDSESLALLNSQAKRGKKRFVNLFDDYDSHGVHHD